MGHPTYRVWKNEAGMNGKLVDRLWYRPNGDTGLARSLDGSVRGLVIGWLRLSVAALMVAGLFAILVAFARSLAAQGFVGEEYFKVSLVGHVTFSLTVWSLSFAGVLWTLAAARTSTPSSLAVGWISLWLSSAGAVLMAGATAVGWGNPLLVDYVPTLEHPVFAVGLGVFFLGTGLCAVNFLVALRHRIVSSPVDVKALGAGAVAYLSAMLVLVLAFGVEGGMDWPTATWGTGHLLQVTNSATMAAAWIILLGGELPKRARTVLSWAVLFYLLPVISVPLFYLLPGPLRMGPVGTITWTGLTVPTFGVWLVVGVAMVRRRRSPSPRLVPLFVSMLLFAVGGYAALMGLEGDSKITAHYHGTVGAVTVALMGIAYCLLPDLKIRLWMPSLARFQPLLYGGGLLLLIAGLFWASNYGGQRKAFEAFAQNSSILGPMGLFGLGALLTVVGGLTFVLGVGVSLLAKGLTPLQAPSSDSDTLQEDRQRIRSEQLR